MTSTEAGKTTRTWGTSPMNTRNPGVIRRPDYRLDPADRKRIAGDMVTATLTRIE